jgi:hypothetical protein
MSRIDARRAAKDGQTVGCVKDSADAPSEPWCVRAPFDAPHDYASAMTRFRRTPIRSISTST